MSTLESSPRITPFLWFNANAGEAVDFYLGIFRNSRRLDEFRRIVDDPGGLKGTVLTIDFELDGQRFTALNGGPAHNFNDAVSFVVHCETQAEVDDYWEKLTAGGSGIACGWLRDKFGLCWQVVPARIAELIRHPGAMQALMAMKKLDIAALERAALD